jgi:Tfp pilus assembly protein PilO
VKPALWRRWLLPVFLVLLALDTVTLFAWTLPHVYRQRHAAAREQDARRELAQVRDSTAALRARAQAISGNGADYQAFYDRYAGDERRDLLPTLQAIEEMSREAGLASKTRSFHRGEIKGTGLERVEISLPLAGSYQQFVDFLGRVEGSSRFLVTDRVSMRADPEGEASLTVELSAYLKTAERPLGERPRRAR